LTTQVDTDTLKVEDQSLFGGASVVDLHPIIFEEAYVKDEDTRFVKIVKGHSEVFTEEQMLAFEAKQQPKLKM
jgi:hypothetical protein